MRNIQVYQLAVGILEFVYALSAYVVNIGFSQTRCDSPNENEYEVSGLNLDIVIIFIYSTPVATKHTSRE